MNICSQRPSQFFVARVHNILQITNEPICAQKLIEAISFFQIFLPAFTGRKGQYKYKRKMHIDKLLQLSMWHFRTYLINIKLN